MQGQVFTWMWMIWLDSVWNSAKLLSSTCGIANLTWLNSGICWRMWLAEGVWYDYNWCYSSGPVMCTAKKVVYLLMWRLFSIPMLHLTWLDKTVPSYVKCIINFSRILCILENSALQKDAYLCIDMSVDDITWQGSTVPSCWVAHAELRTLV